jgi:ribosomal protein L7/L12
MAKEPSNDELERIRAAISSGRKIEAIKIYREASGAGLAEAKEFVEAFAEDPNAVGQAVRTLSDDDVEKIQAAIFAGRKIEAIKLRRDATREGLKEAKDFIEALEAELRRTAPASFTAPAAKGCGSAVICVVVILGIVIVALA